MRKISKLLVVLVLLTVVATLAFAAEGGSLTILGVKSDTVLYQIATEDGTPVVAFESVQPAKLTEDMLTGELALALQTHAREKNVPGKMGTPNQDGKIIYDNLSKGYYLVCSAQEEPAFAPFLISIPLTINGRQVYSIEASPKTNSPDGPFNPVDPTPPEPDIPQTGVIMWPKITLLILGGIAILAGFVEVIAGREKEHD